MTRKTRRSKPGGDDVAKRESGKGPARGTRPEPEDAASAAEPLAEANLAEPLAEADLAEPLAEADLAEPLAEAEPDAGGGVMKEPADAEPASPAGGAQPAKKVTLPAFGFAADLLPKQTGDSKAEEPAPEPALPAPQAAESEAPPTPEIDAADPRRIFAFADGLERGATAEPEAAPVRLETWVAFSLAGEVFALPVAPIREVVRVASITRVPHAPKPIRGVTNRRGRVIPVIDLRLRIELPPAALGRASRVIVVSSRGRLLGLLVDAVHQVIHIDLEQVQPPPDDVMTVQSDYLSGVFHMDDQLILLLDIDRALIIHAAAPEIVGDGATQPEALDAPT